ncbi:hypothetical protein FRC06_008551 [Ceratobasidium sp. 370]|nr:hypothetical protein FRC06_008551 [Ceratobasidium sp. 370]
MSLRPQQPKVTIRKGTKLGSGGFGIVYQATEISTRREVALKQSRVSLRIKRSLLQHEAAVLKLLSGHPAIPEVYAYGRVEHFELLSMQLLHQSLGDAVDKDGPLPLKEVLQIADQLEWVPSDWKAVSSGLSALVEVLSPSRDLDLFGVDEELESSDQDIRHDARMREGNVKLYAQVTPLSRHELLNESIPWYSSRAWFDECVKASRYNDLENGRWWTNAPFPRSPQSSEGEISDSYNGSDFEEWECQQERDGSLTLANGLEGEGEAPEGVLKGLAEIVLEDE